MRFAPRITNLLGIKQSLLPLKSIEHPMILHLIFSSVKSERAVVTRISSGVLFADQVGLHSKLIKEVNAGDGAVLQCAVCMHQLL